MINLDLVKKSMVQWYFMIPPSNHTPCLFFKKKKKVQLRPKLGIIYNRGTYDVVWVIKQVTNEKENIVCMETMLMDHALTWYMKYKKTIAQGVMRLLDEIKHAMLKEFQKPKLRYWCMTKIKEIEQ